MKTFLKGLDNWKLSGRKVVMIALVAILLLGLVYYAVPNLPTRAIDTIHSSFTIKTVEAAGTADATADGTADNVQAQALVTVLPATGGRLYILTGTYVWANGTTVTDTSPNVTISGTGAGTYITGDGVTSPFTPGIGGNNWVLEDLRVSVNTATLLAAMGATTGWEWRNVTTSDGYYALRTAASGSVALGNLTSGRVPIVGGGGTLTDDTTLLYNAGTDTLTTTNLAAPTGRGATYVVAASDAPAHVKNQADYVCTGVSTLSATVANDTGSVTIPGAWVSGTTKTQAGNGNIIVTLAVGQTATIWSGTCVVTGSPKALVAGANNVTITGAGTINLAGMGDEIQIQAAIDALPNYVANVSNGGGVHLSIGNFNTFAPIVIDDPSILGLSLILEGEGEGTIINAVGCYGIQLGSAAAGLNYGTHIRDLVINPISPFGGIEVKGGSDVTIEDISIMYGSYSIYISGNAHGFVVKRSRLIYFGTAGIYNNATCNAWKIEDCNISELGLRLATGIYWKAGVNLSVVGCVLENQLIHIQIDANSGHSIAGCYMEGATSSDIVLGDLTGISLTSVYANGTATSSYFITLGADIRGVSITGCETTGHTVGVIRHLSGYIASEVHQSGNYFTENTKGILSDETISNLNNILALPKADILYPFADGYGTVSVFDISGNLRSGELVASPSWGTLANGIGYLDLNGSAQTIKYQRGGSGLISANGDQTFIFAGYPDFTMAGATENCMWQHQIDADDYMSLLHLATGELQFTYAVGGVYDVIVWATPTFASGNFMVWEITIDSVANVVRIYQNGALVGEKSTSVDYKVNAGKIFISSLTASAYWYDGKICLFGKFPQTSTSYEVLQHYQKICQAVEPKVSHISSGEIRIASGSLTKTGSVLTGLTGTWTETGTPILPGSNTWHCTVAGTATITLPVGTTGTIASGAAIISVPASGLLVAGANAVTCSATGGAFDFNITLNCIAFAWHNPEAQDIFIKKIVIDVTTNGGTATSELEVGIADNAVALNRGTEFFNAFDLNAAAILHDSWLAAGVDFGTQVKWLLCQDSVSATDGWIVGSVLTAIANNLVGTYYIEYVGK